MTKSLTPVQLANNLVVLVAQVNAIIDTLANEIVTANAAPAGATSQGNGFITGIFGANTIVAGSNLRGGNVTTSNTVFLGANLDANSWTIKSGAITINSTVLVVGANLTVNTSTLFIGNSSVNTTINNSTFLSQGNNSLSIGANVVINTSAISIGNSAVNVVINSSGFLTALTILSIGSNVTINTLGYFVGNSSVNSFSNSSSLKVGANVIVNSGSLFIGNALASLFGNSTELYITNTTANVTLIPGQVSVANSTVTGSLALTGYSVGISSINSTAIAIGANLIENSSSLFVGNTTANAFVNSVIIQVANSTSTTNVAPLGIAVGSSIVNSTAVAVGANVIINTSAYDVGNSTINSTSIISDKFIVTAVSANGGLGTAGQILSSNGSSTYWGSAGGTSAIEFIFDGGGAALLTGVQGYLEVPYAATINQVTLLADISGNVTIDIWKTTYANFAPGTHPVLADSITASAVPAMSSASKYQDATLTGWTTSITAGDILGFDVKVAASNATRVTCSLKITRS